MSSHQTEVFTHPQKSDSEFFSWEQDDRKIWGGQTAKTTNINNHPVSCQSGAVHGVAQHVASKQWYQFYIRKTNEPTLCIVGKADHRENGDVLKWTFFNSSFRFRGPFFWPEASQPSWGSFHSWELVICSSLPSSAWAASPFYRYYSDFWNRISLIYEVFIVIYYPE